MIEHKEVVIVCEEGRLVTLSYNVLLTTIETNVVAKLVVHVVKTKFTWTYIKCGKTSHTFETYHNRKKKVPIIPIIVVKFTRLE